MLSPENQNFSQPKNWTQSFREAFRSHSDLAIFLGVKTGFNDGEYPVFIPKALAERIKGAGPGSSLWKQFVPDESENIGGEGLYDPIGDQTHSKANGIIHRYKNRLLFSPTTVCPVNCRYCFRKNELAQKDDILKGKLAALVGYLDDNKQVEEVILTGGDPLMLSNERLAQIFEAIEGKVSYVRIHTRTPVIMPERVDSGFIRLMERICQQFEVVSLAIHANHKEEFCPENERAIKELRSCGVQLLSQSVLLKGVNDSKNAMVDLYKTFAKLGVKSYYLHHPDRVKGAMHFSIPLSEGRKLYSQLRDELPGWAIPHYIIDPENGQGKNLAYNPESLEYHGQLLDRFNTLHRVDR